MLLRRSYRQARRQGTPPAALLALRVGAAIGTMAHVPAERLSISIISTKDPGPKFDGSTPVPLAGG